MQVLLACAAGIFLERVREGDLGSANGGSRHHLGLGNPAVPADYA